MVSCKFSLAIAHIRAIFIRVLFYLLYLFPSLLYISLLFIVSRCLSLIMSSEDHQNRVPGTPCIHCGFPTLSGPGILIPSGQTICLCCRLNPWESAPVQQYKPTPSTNTTPRAPLPRTPAPAPETASCTPTPAEVNSGHLQQLQEAKNGRTGAITSARKEGPGSGTSAYSQHSEKPAPTVYQFFFRISNGWDDLVGEGEKGWSCWLPVDLDEVATTNDNNVQSEFYKLQPIQRLLVQIVYRWPGWKKYCEKHHVSMDIGSAYSLGIAFLVGGGKTGKGATSNLSPISWPEPPNQYTTLGEVFRAYNVVQQVTLGISVTDAQFVTRDALVKRVQKEAFVKRETSLPAPEVKIKTEPVFGLQKRTTAPSGHVEVIDLSSDDDDSLPELSEVILEVAVKLEKGNQHLEVGHKREGSLSSYQPPSGATKRSKPTKPTTKSTSAKLTTRKGEESEEEKEGEGLIVELGEEEQATPTQGQATPGLWEKLDKLRGGASRGEQSEENNKGSKTKSGRRVQFPQRFTN
jgi:hypothetical protein